MSRTNFRTSTTLDDKVVSRFSRRLNIDNTTATATTMGGTSNNNGGSSTSSSATASCGVFQIAVFLVAIVTGTACSICSKTMMSLHAVGMHGDVEAFSKPLFQTFGEQFLDPLSC